MAVMAFAKFFFEVFIIQYRWIFLLQQFALFHCIVKLVIIEMRDEGGPIFQNVHAVGNIGRYLNEIPAIYLASIFFIFCHNQQVFLPRL